MSHAAPSDADAPEPVAESAVAAADQATDAADAPAEGTGSAFPLAGRREKGYEPRSVDAFLARARAVFEDGDGAEAITSEAVRTVAFPLVAKGYSVIAVDAALSRIEDAFAAKEREDSIARDGTHAWVESARDSAQVILDRLSRPKGHRFARAGWLRFGYRIDEVDVVADKLRGYFEAGAPVTPDQVRGVAFRMQRRGYREEQVDAVLDAVIDVMLAVR